MIDLRVKLSLFSRGFKTPEVAFSAAPMSEKKQRLKLIHVFWALITKLYGFSVNTGAEGPNQESNHNIYE